VPSCSLLLISGSEAHASHNTPSSSDTPVQSATQTAPQLRQHVAPIALYPDVLVGQILAAATYPDQIVEADRWLQGHSALNSDQLAAEIDKQPWGPAVKAVAEFPTVLGTMDKNLAWTSTLGDAYVNQQKDVMAAIQSMRQLAQEREPSEHRSAEVTTQGRRLRLRPVNTEIVYVPQYDPWLVYGGPIGPWPGWCLSGLTLGAPGDGLRARVPCWILRRVWLGMASLGRRLASLHDRLQP
jgi:Protein of unknown function (DUF3300)